MMISWENFSNQNVQPEDRVVLRGKGKTLNVYIRKEEKSQYKLPS